MNKRSKIFLLFLAFQIYFLTAVSVFAQVVHQHTGTITFTENKNQWDASILYKADIGGGSVFLEKKCFTYVFEDVDAVRELMSYKFLDSNAKKTKKPPSNLVNYHAYKVYFTGSVNEPVVSSEAPSSEYYNYFIGNDQSHWASNVRKYKKVTYTNLYNNIDLNVYEQDFHLKYDYIVHPGANTDDIQLLYEGADDLSINDKNLVIKTSVNRVIELKPYAYQEIDGQKKEVTCKFKLHKNTLSFVLPDGYDSSVDLIIDPILIFSTYSGSTADNWGYSATYDSQGFLFAAGNVFAIGYPTTIGSYQTSFGGGNCDIAITKYDTTGQSLIYGTYLGGTGPEVPNSTIVNSNDELFVLGTTGSNNFPVTAGAYDNTFNGGTNYTLTYVLNYTSGSDIVISHFSADGTQLIGSTYFGGSGNDGLNGSAVLKHNYADDVRGEIMIDENNNIYVVSSTSSADFPITSGSFQQTFGGGQQDGCILKMDNNLSTLIWSSYIGGSGDDAVYAVTLDDNQDMYICGGTTSTNFPLTPGTLQQNFMGGSCDGYITKINQNGNTIIRSTYYGSSAYDQTYLLELDKQNNVYVVGQTEAAGNTWIYNALWNTPNSGQFISKLNPDLTLLTWSTAFGTGSGIPNISPTAFLVDLCGNIYMSGWGGSVNGFGGTSGLPVTANAF
ncbi:MAG: SBBP repeat-containing protein, partial [Bacteroidota bacterium]